jgi:hypothetical protein
MEEKQREEKNPVLPEEKARIWKAGDMRVILHFHRARKEEKENHYYSV